MSVVVLKMVLRQISVQIRLISRFQKVIFQYKKVFTLIKCSQLPNKKLSLNMPLLIILEFLMN